ncbi:MAG: DUF2071 domain-containing protein [Acidobacteria bacterium]|nr:DUF2071 domain-containing protein [Acidobacteriota bacterium]
MILRTVVRDCLLLNWILPIEALPPLPLPLRYEIHPEGGESKVVATAYLFFHEGFRLAALPIVRFSYPQFSLGLAVVDGDGVSSVLLCRVLVPAWVIPAARLVAREPVESARLDFDRPSAQLEAGSWRWSVSDGAGFAVEAEQGMPAGGAGDRRWCEQVEQLRGRRRSYFRTARGFRRIATELPRVDPWPMKARVGDTSLLVDCLSGAGGEVLDGADGWPEVDAAFFFAELPLRYDLSLAPPIRFAHGVPQPAASRRCAL